MPPDFEDLEGLESYQQPDYAERMYEAADNARKRDKEAWLNCGHHASQAVTGREGTSYCRACEGLARFGDGAATAGTQKVLPLAAAGFECVVDESAGLACPRCDGSGEVTERGMSVNPGSGVMVPDPQCDVSGRCPVCGGTGVRVGVA